MVGKCYPGKDKEGRKPGRIVAGSSVSCFLVSCLRKTEPWMLASVHAAALEWPHRQIRPLVPAGDRAGKSVDMESPAGSILSPDQLMYRHVTFSARRCHDVSGFGEISHDQ